MFTADISGWNAALMLFQHCNDLLFAEPRSLHNPSPSLRRTLPQSGGGNGSQDIEDIDHSKTKANSPQTNGICERFHRTIKDEFYDIAFRKKLYRSVEELQTDLDHWLVKYNEQRPHSGRYCYGKTPMQTFRETLHIAVEKTIRTPELPDNTETVLSAAE